MKILDFIPRSGQISHMTNDPSLADKIRSGNRRALSRAITLVESRRPDHRATAEALIADLSATRDQSLRIGLSGTPGVGKSTFIEALGSQLTAKGHRVAVLAVDPSSARSGGSILGDKTRMDQLSRDPNAFIRPSPAGTELGGVARRTREAAILCEAAGFDIILIETVGVGQSEITVAQMTDLFLLLMAPAGGDELQGVKRGIMEIADLILINKADGDLLPAATRTCADYAGALRLFRARDGDAPGIPRAMLVSAQTGKGLDEAWDAVAEATAARRASGFFEKRRAQQAHSWFQAELQEGLLALLNTPEARAVTDKMARAIAAGETTPVLAARQVLKQIADGTK